MKKIINKILFLISISFTTIYTNFLITQKGPFDKLIPKKIIKEVEKGLGLWKTLSFWLNIKEIIIKWVVISLIIILSIIVAIIIFKKMKKEKQKV